MASREIKGKQILSRVTENSCNCSASHSLSIRLHFCKAWESWCCIIVALLAWPCCPHCPYPGSVAAGAAGLAPALLAILSLHGWAQLIAWRTITWILSFFHYLLLLLFLTEVFSFHIYPFCIFWEWKCKESSAEAFPREEFWAVLSAQCNSRGITHTQRVIPGLEVIHGCRYGPGVLASGLECSPELGASGSCPCPQRGTGTEVRTECPSHVTIADEQLLALSQISSTEIILWDRAPAVLLWLTGFLDRLVGFFIVFPAWSRVSFFRI